MRVWFPSFCLGLVLLSATGAAAQQQPPIRLSQLHDALHLSADQEPAWRTYTAALAPNPQADARHNATRLMLPKLTSPRRIALINATMEQDLDDFRHQGDAVVTFYGRLTPDQQAIFDRQTAQAGNNNRPSGD